MSTQTTGGGSTTSFINAPQAVDDSYCYSEDSLLSSSIYNTTTKAVTLDVMSNDLGGSAKALFSVDDGNGNVLEPDFELLCKDVNSSGCSPWEKTPDGNWIRINNGKIEFKLGNPLAPDDPAQALDINSLGTDRSVDDEFVYAIRLANGTLSQAVVHIHIAGENDAVVLGAVTNAAINDTAADDTFADITGTLTSTDADFGDTPTYGLDGAVAAVGDPNFDLKKVTAYGTLYLNSTTGAYKFVADNAAVQGLDSDDAAVALTFGVNVSDGDTSDSDTLTITLNGANDTPELAAPTAATITDTAANDPFADITGSLAGSDRDLGETLVYGLSDSVASDDAAFDYMKSTAYGTLYLDKETGAYKFVSDNAAIQGLDSEDAAVVLNFGVSVSDGDASDGDTLVITINGANDAVELAAVTDVTITDTAVDNTFADITGSLVGSDRDLGETLTYGLDGAVAAAGDPAFDLKKVTDYGTLYLNSTTGAYKFVANDGAIEGLDSDDEDVLLNFGVSVTDDDTTASDTLTITLDGANDAPDVANAIADQSVNEDTEWEFEVPADTFSDRDAGEILAYSATLEGGDPLPDWLDFDADTRTFSGTPPQDFNGSLNLTVTATDGDESASDTFTLTINPVNDAPVNVLPASYVTNEDTAKQLTGLSVEDVDADSGTIKVTLSVNSGTLTATGGGGVSVVGSGTGTIELSGTLVAINAFLAAASAPTFTPALNANGDVTLTMTTTDNGNTGAGGPLTDSDTRTISVTSVNDAPAGTNGNVGTLEDTAKVLSAADFGFTDPSDSPANAFVAVKITTLPATGTLTLDGTAVAAGDFVSLADINNGLLVYTPAANATASASFTFQVQDNGGTTNGGVDLDASANTLTINITAVNDAPAGSDLTIAAIEDTNKVLQIADFGFTDPNDSPANDLLAVKITTLPSGGTLQLDGDPVIAGQIVSAADIADGKLVYVPAGDATGPVTFTFQVQDDGGTANGGADLDASANTLTLNIAAVNDKPVNTIAGYSTNEDTPKQLTGLSVSDVDAGSGAIKVTLSVNSGTLTATGAGGVSILGSGTGTIELSGTLAAINAFLAAASAPTFNPALNANGDVTLTMTTTDNGFTGSGGAQTDTDSVTISVAAVNDAAVITGDDTGEVTEDAVPNTAGGNLDSTDVDGTNDLWTAETIESAFGALTINSNGTWTYTLDNGAAAVDDLNDGDTPTDTFTVKTADGTEHQITITINGNTDFTYVSPAPFTGTGDPNDFDSLGNPLGENLASSGTNGNDTIYGGAGVDTINGGNGDDTIYAGSGNDGVNGGNNNDRLFGGSGIDTISGANDIDTIIGGYGADILTGNNGADTFFYLSQKDTGDTITDFSKVQGDKIKFDTSFGFDASDFAGAISTAGEVDAGKFGYKYDSGTNTTIIYVDTDGAFGADMEIKLTGNIALASGDFLFGGL